MQYLMITLGGLYSTFFPFSVSGENWTIVLVQLVVGLQPLLLLNQFGLLTTACQYLSFIKVVEFLLIWDFLQLLVFV